MVIVLRPFGICRSRAAQLPAHSPACVRARGVSGKQMNAVCLYSTVRERTRAPDQPVRACVRVCVRTYRHGTGRKRNAEQCQCT